MGAGRKASAGFTLIELMIVVALVGILAAVAIPLFMDAVKRSRNTEAQLQLNKLGKRAVEEYHANSVFPTVTAPLTPATDCCTQNVGGKRRCAVAAADWATPAWGELEFVVAKEFFFQYSYTPGAGATTFQAVARGDLDCDGVFVNYTIDGAAADGVPTLTLIEPPSGAD